MSGELVLVTGGSGFLGAHCNPGSVRAIQLQIAELL